MYTYTYIFMYTCVSYAYTSSCACRSYEHVWNRYEFMSVAFSSFWKGPRCFIRFFATLKIRFHWSSANRNTRLLSRTVHNSPPRRSATPLIHPAEPEDVSRDKRDVAFRIFARPVETSGLRVTAFGDRGFRVHNTFGVLRMCVGHNGYKTVLFPSLQ